MTAELTDPVELLFGTQLGGGTDINSALGYCQGLVRSPQDTVLVLISDLYEGGNRNEMLKRAASLAASGVKMIALLALDDRGAPSFDHAVASASPEWVSRHSLARLNFSPTSWLRPFKRRT